MSDPTSSMAVQATATTTLLGVVAYLTYALARNGGLNAHEFHKHLDDLAYPVSPHESAQEQAMRASIITAVRNAIDEGADLAANP